MLLEPSCSVGALLAAGLLVLGAIVIAVGDMIIVAVVAMMIVRRIAV